MNEEIKKVTLDDFPPNSSNNIPIFDGKGGIYTELNIIYQLEKEIYELKSKIKEREFYIKCIKQIYLDICSGR